jgi:soluble lytic murein transglycosylase-like protein
MLRAAAMLLVGTIALAPSTGSGQTFACKDAQGNWVLGNVEQHRCVGKVKKITQGGQEAWARPVPTSRSGAAVKAILLAPTAYREHIRRAAAKYALSEELLHAVMAVESGYRATAISEKGAMGLMQLMPGTARDMYVRDVWSPEDNIDGGARYLRTLANQYDGDLTRTLAAYNAGPEAVKRAGGVPRYPETRDYVRRVLEIYYDLKNRNASSRSDG